MESERTHEGESHTKERERESRMFNPFPAPGINLNCGELECRSDDPGVAKFPDFLTTGRKKRYLGRKINRNHPEFASGN